MACQNGACRTRDPSKCWFSTSQLIDRRFQHLCLQCGRIIITESPKLLVMDCPAPVAPCDCPAAGWCARHAMKKTPHLFKLCQTRADYRALWDAMKSRAK